MTASNLSGRNFWGGPTYVRDTGYVQLDNNGRIQHREWQELSCDTAMRGVERLEWITSDGTRWLDEERQIAVSEIDPGGMYWSLDLVFRLVNCAGHPLVFGSPTTEGRPAAGTTRAAAPAAAGWLARATDSESDRKQSHRENGVPAPGAMRQYAG